MLPLVASVIEETDEDDRAFIAVLYRQYYPLMKKKAFEISHDYSVVDDLINDAFVRLIEKTSILKSLECCQRTSYIVYTIRNISINYIRQRANKSEKMYLGMSEDLFASIPDAECRIEEICAMEEDYKELSRAIGQLSERDRSLLYYKYNLELSDKEISAMMDISLNNIREYLKRARRRTLRYLQR